MVVKACLLVMVASAVLVRAEDKPAATCGDLLAELNRKPNNLEFVSCSKDTEGIGKPLDARYRVAGVHAVEVEKYLIQNFHLPRLRKSCCQWDGKPGYYKGGKYQWYEVRMGAEEGDNAKAFAATRAEWRKIPYFYVNVEVLTEDP